MNSNRLALAALIIACVAAGAGGGYLATRQTLPGASAASADASSVGSDAAPTATPVKEAEAPTVAPASVPKPVEPPTATHETAAPRRSVVRPAPSAQTSGARADQSSVDRPAPGNDAVSPSPAPSAPIDAAAANTPIAVDNRPVFQEPASIPELPPASFEELVVSADSVIGLQLDGEIVE